MTTAKGFVVPAGGGKRFDSPTQGRFFAMKLLGRETGESIMMFEETLPAGTASLYHLHRDSDEVAWVLEGEFTFKIGDEITIGGPGTCAFMPRNVAACLEEHRQRDRPRAVSVHPGRRRRPDRGAVGAPPGQRRRTQEAFRAPPLGSRRPKPALRRATGAGAASSRLWCCAVVAVGKCLILRRPRRRPSRRACPREGGGRTPPIQSIRDFLPGRGANPPQSEPRSAACRRNDTAP